MFSSFILQVRLALQLGVNRDTDFGTNPFQLSDSLCANLTGNLPSASRVTQGAASCDPYRLVRFQRMQGKLRQTGSQELITVKMLVSLKTFFIQCLKATFHLQSLQNVLCLPMLYSTP